METTRNTFEGGLILDTNIATTPSNALSNALNATISTFNGNELILLNDMGNVMIPYKDEDETKYAQLEKGFVPIGVKSFGNIMYIISYNPSTGEGEVGCFPSPNYTPSKDGLDYDKRSGLLIYKYSPLNIGVDGSNKDVMLRTKYFNFDLQHPVEVLAEKSYDDSVNLIFTDNKNIPRLINTGFSVTEDNTYTIINRIGKEKHTNRYDVIKDVDGKILHKTKFDLLTSLYRDVSELSYVNFKGLESGGLLKVGTYVIYIVSCDRDGNETDIICESGVIPVFLGTDGDPFSVNGGSENQVSDKSIKLEVENIDDAYHYVKVYYTRSAAANNQNETTLAYKVLTLYPVVDNKATITLTGYEDAIDIALSDLNLQYFNADCVKTLCITQNILFLGNIKELSYPKDEYEFLRRISLLIYPTIDNSVSVNMQSDYTYSDFENQNSYYSSKFCYNYTGYHFGEIYRFGIVYIRNDNSLTSVFDVLGVNELTSSSEVPSININNIDLDNTNLYIINNYNIKGVTRIVPTDEENQLSVIGIKFNTDNFILLFSQDEKSNNYKGFFFVRQKRIPTLLALAYTTNVCEEAFVPSINIHITTQNEKGETVEATRYLYESFCSSGFVSDDNGQLDLTNFYPLKYNKTASVGLYNSYQTRLFTLTDTTRFYRDKIDLNLQYAYSKFALDFGSIITYPEWQNGYLYWRSDDDYHIAINANNCIYHDDGKFWYWTYTFFGTKISKSDIDESNITEIKTYTISEYPTQQSNLGWPHGGDGPTAILVQSKLFTEVYFKNVNMSSASHPIIVKEPVYVKFKNSYYRVDAEHYHDDIFRSGTLTTMLLGFYDICLHELKPTKIGLCAAHEYTLVNKPDNINIDDDTDRTSDKSLQSYTDDLSGQLSSYNGKYSYPHAKDSDTPDYQTQDKYALKYNPMEYNSYAAFCPEYELYKAHYNNIFTGSELITLFATKHKPLTRVKNLRLYIYNNTDLYYPDNGNNENPLYLTNLLGVEEGISLSSITHKQTVQSDDKAYKLIRDKYSYFSTKCGNEFESIVKFAGAKFLAYIFPVTDKDYSNSKVESEKEYRLNYQLPFNVLRGIYSPYIGCFPMLKQEINNNVSYKSVPDFANRIINIYIPGYDIKKLSEYFQLRFDDKRAYYTISDKISLKALKEHFDNNNIKDPNKTCYRGDCFVGWFTHRVNRNFNDPSAPYNDLIINSSSALNLFDPSVFKVAYRTFENVPDTTSAEKLLTINVGDLNAILLGSWVTFPIRSSMNISIRSTDESWTDEKHKSGNSRSFYPLHAIDASGSYKMPDSDNYNSSFSKSGGDKLYFNLNNIIFENQYFKNRITYSNIMVNGAFENGNRVFLSTHYRDYTELYGSIVKILTINGDLVVVCEHGILYLPVRERVHAGNGSTGLIFINSPNILPEVPGIISDTYGSTWPESIIQTPYGIFGVDAIAKKIWYTNGTSNSFLLISDFRVLSFLNKGLSMWNKQLELNKTNIKTHYNAFKNDVMFTAYDYPEDPNDNVMWNLCYNINAAHSNNGWQTFYSWIPSFSGNIGNNFITFNHVADKNIIKNKFDIIDNQDYGSLLWKHGLSEFIPGVDRILPTKWYGELHPFEFEFVINNDPINHKIFNNLRIISNKAEPESFHYEVIGECYDFDHIQLPPGSEKEQVSDKPNMYYRLELIKAFYLLYCNSLIRYNKNFKDVIPVEVYKSTMFPLYYMRKGVYNLIYDSYQALTANGYEYLNLSGAEIVYDLLLNEFKICNHVQGVDIRKNGRLRGNMHYKEDGWYVLIPSINYVQKNEYTDYHLDQNNPKLKLSLGNTPPPYDAAIPDSFDVSVLNQKLGLSYTGSDITFDLWDSGRKEMRIKDKYLRIKIRYSGSDLAVITGIITLYTNSYS